MLNRKALVFPFSKINLYVTIEILLREKNAIVASFSGSKMIERDIMYSVECEKKGYIVYDIKRLNFDEIDTVYLLDDDTFIIDENMKEYLSKHLSDKKIIAYDEKVIDRYLSNKFRIDLKIGGLYRLPQINLNYKNINVPIVGVMGFFNQIENEGLVYKLRNQFLNKSIRTSVIVANNNSSIIGCTPYVKSLFSKSSSLPRKIIELNSLLRSVISMESPDIIILEVLDGPFRLSENILNNFGEFCHIVSEAVGVDYLVININQDMTEMKSVLEIKKIIESKYRMYLEAINVTNSYYDFNGINNIYSEVKLSHSPILFDYLGCIDNDKMKFGINGDIKFIKEVINDTIKKCEIFK